LKTLAHPLKPEILLLDRAVRSVSPTIRSGVKWNSLSWATREGFGTVFLRSTDSVQVVLHFGAKNTERGRPTIPDPVGLLAWRGADRAVVSLGRGAEFQRNLAPFSEIVRRWIEAL